MATNLEGKLTIPPATFRATLSVRRRGCWNKTLGWLKERLWAIALLATSTDALVTGYSIFCPLDYDL